MQGNTIAAIHAVVVPLQTQQKDVLQCIRSKVPVIISPRLAAIR